jgi:MoxR-like ATPase
MKINDIFKALSTQFAEREEVIEGMLLALIARQHTLLIGPPGTAKSALIADLASRITGCNYFQWLLTRFSTPEELFGPVSLKELEQGVYKRNTNRKLPAAHLAFCDEIFKGNSAILNSLLTLINERLFYNNGGPVQSPLISVIGSSNEYPEEGEGLEALFDRFLIRFEIDYIGEDLSFISMLRGSAPIPATMSLDELYELQFFSDMVTIPVEVLETLAQIRKELKDQGIRPSDRRFKQALSIIRAKATLSGRQEALVEDILFLKNSLWEQPEQREAVVKIVKKYAQDVVKSRLDEINTELLDILNGVREKQGSTDQALEATEKLKAIHHELRKMEQANTGRAEITQAISCVQDSIKQIATEVLGV